MSPAELCAARCAHAGTCPPASGSGTPPAAKKRDRTPAQRTRREAESAQPLEHHSVIGLTAVRESDDRTDMITDDAGDHTLADPAAMTPEELFTALTASADAIADLHEAGWSHGAICAEHLVIGDTGSVTLCSLGTAAMHDADGIAVAEDLRQLRAVIDAGLRHPGQDWSLRQRRRWRRLRHRARRTMHDRRPRSDGATRSARVLADSLRTVEASNRAPGPTPRATPPPARLTRTPATLVAAAAFVGVSALFWSTASSPAGVASAQPSARPSRAAPSPPLTTAPGPTTPASEQLEEVAVTGNEIQAGGLTFRAGTDGDLLALADPDCTGSDRVMLLRPSTGQLFEFPAWPSTGRPTRAHLRSVHPGAVDLDVIDPALGSESGHRCDRLVLRYSDEVPTPAPGTPAPASGSDLRPSAGQEEP